MVLWCCGVVAWPPHGVNGDLFGCDGRLFKQEGAMLSVVNRASGIVHVNATCLSGAV